MSRWREGDIVTPLDDPEQEDDPVGVVVMVTADGDVLVDFPLGGGGSYRSEELRAADRSSLLKECPWTLGDTVAPDSVYGHPGEVTDPDDPEGWTPCPADHTVGQVIGVSEWGYATVQFPCGHHQVYAPESLSPPGYRR
ncbi:hypothetical protein ABZ876_11880 [Streptomyces sp. NPDC046931]|uniref:hypothetical protein n=1 Tax=Streptomyces sp. NPDC046931 TaxID=3154806 RepID=UPI0033EACC44